MAIGASITTTRRVLKSRARIVATVLVALASAGCAHAATRPHPPASADDGDDPLVVLQEDNARLRRKLADLEDRVIRLERSADRDDALPDRDLPVVRLRPPAADAEPEAEAPRPRTQSRALVPSSRSSAARRLADVPDSGAPSEADDDGGLDVGPIAASSDERGKSYRLVGNHLVEMTKAKAPKRPDRPARDAAGNALVAEYETAMALYKAGEIAGAERAFDLFASAHPKHDFADNALYWKGESAYDQGHFDDALTAFTTVVERYGGGNKAPDALLKIGLCYGKLGDVANARDVLTELVAAYPDARASDIARARLVELEG